MTMFKCDECGKYFAWKDYLSRHVTSVHEGVIHRCDKCDKYFAHKGNLHVHKKSAHENVKF